jgi:hypothetical protein
MGSFIAARLVLGIGLANIGKVADIYKSFFRFFSAEGEKCRKLAALGTKNATLPL